MYCFIVFFNIFTWKYTARHNCVQMQIFTFHLARWLRTRLVIKPTFRPSALEKHRVAQWITTFPPFRTPASSFFSLFLFSSLALLASAFPCVHTVGSLTAKLPSIIRFNYPVCPYCKWPPIWTKPPTNKSVANYRIATRPAAQFPH